MHKKCKEILDKLNREQKIKISNYKFPEKQELKLKLKDLIEEKVDEKYFLSPQAIEGRLTTKYQKYKLKENIIDNKKVHPTILARFEGAPTLTSCSNDQPKIQESFVSKHYNNFIKKNGYLPKFFNPYHETEIKDIVPTQTTNCGSYGSSASVCIGENECKINEFPSIIQKQGDRGTNKYSTNSENSYTISANPMSDRNQLLVEKLEGAENNGNFILASTQNHAGINKEGIVPTLTSAMGNGGGHIPMHNYNYRIRKLTPKECWRLMGFDDEDFEKASKTNSNTQLYKQAGNSIVVNVLYNIIKNLIRCEV